MPIDEAFDIYEIPHQQSDPSTQLPPIPAGSIQFRQCDITNWKSLRDTFLSFKHIDIAVANAGVSEDPGYFTDILDQEGQLKEPAHHVVDVNFRSVLNFTKLALRQFQKQQPGNSLVITSSATAYSPEQSLPVYSATKLAVSCSCSCCLGGPVITDSSSSLVSSVDCAPWPIYTGRLSTA